MTIQAFYNPHMQFPKTTSAPSAYTPQSSVKLNKTRNKIMLKERKTNLEK